jgi:ribosomal RNA-processing protein 36
MSSKRAVSRKRSVVDVPRVNARDPRFSSLSGQAVDASTLERRYGFLHDYRASELAGLKKKTRETKEADEKERLKREIKAMEDRERTRKKVEAEREVVREHRRQERERVKDGKKPYFLKKSDVKKKLLEKRFEELGQKKAEKVMERRRRKQASKERKEMPRSRREQGDGGFG